MEHSDNSTLDGFIEAIGMKVGRECFATWYGVCDTSTKAGMVSQRARQQLRSGMRRESLSLQQIWDTDLAKVALPEHREANATKPARR